MFCITALPLKQVSNLSDFDIFFTEDASSSDEEIKQINRELSSKKFTSQLNSMTSGRNTGGGNRHLLGTLIFLVLDKQANIVHGFEELLRNTSR